MNRATALETLLISGGRIAFVGFWFIAVLVVYRGLGHGEEGLAAAGGFALAIACVKTASGFISDPIDLAAMRLVPPLLASDAGRAAEVMRAGTVLRLGAAGLTAAALLAAPALAGALPSGWDVLLPLLPWVALAVVADSLLRVLLVAAQSAERFGVFIALEGTVSLLRFLGVTALWAAGAMRLDLVLACYAGAPLVVALAGVLAGVGPRGALGRVLPGDVLAIVAYLKWMVPAMVLAAFAERTDVFLLTTLSDAAAVGLYGAALTLALVPDIVTGCVSVQFQPRIVRLHAEGRYGAVLRGVLRVSMPLCAAAFALSLVLSRPVFGLLLGPRYVEALPAFEWLLAGTLFWLAVVPLPMTLVAVLAPRRVALLTLAQTLFVVTFGLLVIPHGGWVGMAAVVCAMRVCVALLILVSARGLAASPASPAPEGPLLNAGLAGP